MSPKKSKPAPPSSSFVDSLASVEELVNKLVKSLSKLPVGQIPLYIGCKTSQLDGGKDAISLLQLFVLPQNHIYLIDVHALGSPVFTMMERDGQSLRSILQSDLIPKVFFDVRLDCYLLFTHFGIALQCVQDIQLMDWVSRSPDLSPLSRQPFRTLFRCLRSDARIPQREKDNWQAVYNAARSLYDPCMGGSLQAFSDRPLKKDVRAYCVLNLQYLPGLHNLYWDRLIKLEREQMLTTETTMRLRLNQVHKRTFVVGPRHPPQPHQIWRPYVSSHSRYRPLPNIGGLELEELLIKDETSHMSSVPKLKRLESKEWVMNTFKPANGIHAFRGTLRQAQLPLLSKQVSATKRLALKFASGV